MNVNNIVRHIPVMLTEALEGLRVEKGKWYIDGTFGRGGHTREIIARGGKVIALDRDEEAVKFGQQSFEKEIAENNLMIIKKNFGSMSEVDELKGKEIAGVLFDFGLNSDQLDSAQRGFSFQTDAPLDMRIDKDLAVTAKDLVNGLGRKELYDLLTLAAQEFRARAIVDAILRYRVTKQIETTKELADIIYQAVRPQKREHSHIHPATKTFLALRIAVNDELGEIKQALPTSLDLLQPMGRLVAISFHESEDRVVKEAMKRWIEEEKGQMLTKKPLQPTEREIQENPRSRSAKLRIFEKGMKE